MSAGTIKIDTATSGQVLLKAAVAGKRIVVTSFVFQCAGAVNVKFQSANTDLTGAFPNAANTGVPGAYNPDGWFWTAVNEVLNINLSAAIQVSGVLTYRLED